MIHPRVLTFVHPGDDTAKYRVTIKLGSTNTVVAAADVPAAMTGQGPTRQVVAMQHGLAPLASNPVPLDQSVTFSVEAYSAAGESSHVVQSADFVFSNTVDELAAPTDPAESA